MWEAQQFVKIRRNKNVLWIYRGHLKIIKVHTIRKKKKKKLVLTLIKSENG
jgi:hypothetical protein